MEKKHIDNLLELKKYIVEEIGDGSFDDENISPKDFISEIESNGFLVRGGAGCYIDTIDGSEFASFVSSKFRDVKEAIFVNLENGHFYFEGDNEFPDLMKKIFDLDYDESTDEYVFKG